MRDSVSIQVFIRAIEALPSDKPRDRPGIWYRTQKEHWLGWLGEYEGPGGYGRQVQSGRDARFAYNHIVNPQMLLWLNEAAGVDSSLVSASREAASNKTTMMAQSGAIRKIMPWKMVESALFNSQSAHPRSSARSSSVRSR